MQVFKKEVIQNTVMPRWKTILFKTFGKKIVTHDSECRVVVFSWGDRRLITSVEYIN
jgi:hypothetical protein